MMKRIAPLFAVLLVSALAAFAVGGPSGGGSGGEPNCTDVAGQMNLVALNLSDGRIGATMNGDIEALRRIQILDIERILTPTGIVIAIKGRGVIVTDSGTMRTRDRIFLKQVTPGEPQRHWRGVHRIVNGNGDYENATGRIISNGIIGPGAHTLNYQGEICLPAPTP